MDFEKYTERSRGFIQSAQGLALRSGHQRFTPEHILKVLLDDKEGLAANLIRAAGGDPAKALAAVEAELKKLPSVEGAGAGQLYLAPETARVFEVGRQAGREGGRQLRHRRAAAAGARHGGGHARGRHPQGRRRHRPGAQHRHQRHPQGPHRRQRERRAGL